MAITVTSTPLGSTKSARDLAVSINGTTTLTTSSPGGSNTHWEIRLANNNKVIFAFRVTASHTVKPIRPAIINSVSLASIRLHLNRKQNYEVRTKPDTGAWSSWSTVNLTGSLRIMGPRQRDKYNVVNGVTGATVTATNRKHTINKKFNGASITTDYSTFRKNRTF